MEPVEKMALIRCADWVPHRVEEAGTRKPRAVKDGFCCDDIVCHKRPLYKLRRSRTVRPVPCTEQECIWKS
jgi:hypothetical protein